MKLTADDLRQLVVDSVKEFSAEQADRIEESMQKSIEKGSNDTTNRVRDLLEKDGSGYRMEKPKIEKGELAGGFIRCVAAAELQRKTPLEIAHRQYGDDHPVTKALEASDADAGGFLVPAEFSSEVIELLRATAVIESAGPRRVPLNSGSMDLPKHTTGATGSWIGEGSNITKTEPAFGMITLTAKKYASLVPISNDLLRYASPDVDRLVRDDMVRDIATAEDLKFIRGDGTAAAPKGLRYQEGINTFSGNATASLANVTTDLVRCIRELMADNVNITRGHWFFSPRTWQYLFSVRDGNGNQVFASEMRAGTLYGYPFSVTTQIPENLGGGSDESELYFVNMDDVIIGRASTIEVMASNTAAYHDGSNVQASFSLDQTVVRAISRVDLAVRHAESVCAVTAWKYGA